MKQRITSILVWIYWTICFCLSLIIITALFIITWPFDKYRKIPNYILKLLGWLVLRPIPTWNFEIDIPDELNLNQPTLVVANHQSFLDIPLLYLLPWNMKWVTKKSMRKIPILGWMITMTGHIPIDRKSLRSFQALDRLIEPIRRGIPGMIFPEGTRSRDGHVQRLKRGAFRLALTHDLQIMPVVISGGFRAMPPGSWKFRFHNKFTISVLTPVPASEFENENDLKSYIHQLMQNKLDDIQSEQGE